MSDRELVASEYQGFIDAIEDGRIFGWAFDPDDPQARLDIDLFHGRTRIGTVRADRYREDLVDYASSNGRNAFVFNLPKDLWAADPAAFHACYAGTSLPLLRGPRCSMLKRDALTGAKARTVDETGIGADFEAVAARIEACERAVVSLVHLAHPGSDHQRVQAARVAEVNAAVERVRQSLTELEAFTLRNDERLKEAETGLARSADATAEPWFQRLDVWALIVAAIAVLTSGLIPVLRGGLS